MGAEQDNENGTVNGTKTNDGNLHQAGHRANKKNEDGEDLHSKNSNVNETKTYHDRTKNKTEKGRTTSTRPWGWSRTMRT